MRLRRIGLERVRQFDQPVEVRGLRPGLNLLAGPNEVGKSTLLDALRAGLFLPHGSRKAGSLQHFEHRTAPIVRLELETGTGAAWRLEKRFLISPRAALEGPAGVRFEGRAADVELAGLLGGEPEPTPGLWNLLLVAQGAAIDPRVPGDARAVLQASLEAALGGEPGGQSAKALIARLRDQRGTLVHGGHGAPIRDYRKVIDRLQDLEHRIESLIARREENRADLDALERVLAERARVRAASPDAAETAALEARLVRARLHETARHAVLRAEADLDSAARSADQRARMIEAVNDLQRRLQTADRLEAETRQALQQAESAGREIRVRHDALTSRRQLLAELAADLTGVQRLDRALGAEASEVAFVLSPEGRGRVRLDGEHPTAGRFALRVRERLTVEIEGIGRLEVRPAPDRTAPLRHELDALAARIAACRTDLGLGPEEAVEPRRAEVEAALAEAERALLAAREHFGAVQEQHRAAETGARGVRGLLERAVRELEAARLDVPDDAITATRRARETVLEQARSDLERAPADQEGDVDVLEARLARLREAARLETALDQQALELRTRIETRAADGLVEQIDELEAERRGLAARRDEMAREVALLRLLEATLDEAEAAVRERYLEPLLARLQPHLEAVLPGARATLDEDLQVTLIERQGAREPFAGLSHGTREQIAIVTRLAFAEVLADQGRPAVVVLDDALVFSDDERLRCMFQVLERAERLQILVLTCRARAFDGLNAHRVRLTSAVDVTGEAAA